VASVWAIRPRNRSKRTVLGGGAPVAWSRVTTSGGVCRRALGDGATTAVDGGEGGVGFARYAGFEASSTTFAAAFFRAAPKAMASSIVGFAAAGAGALGFAAPPRPPVVWRGFAVALRAAARRSTSS